MYNGLPYLTPKTVAKRRFFLVISNITWWLSKLKVKNTTHLENLVSQIMWKSFFQRSSLGNCWKSGNLTLLTWQFINEALCLDFLHNYHNNLCSGMIFQNDQSVSTQLHKPRFKEYWKWKRKGKLSRTYLKFQQWELCLLMLS